MYVVNTTVQIIFTAPKAEEMYHLIEPWLGKKITALLTIGLTLLNISLAPGLGQGLLIANGNRWYRSRRLLTPAFHFDILKPYIHVYNEATNILLVSYLFKSWLYNCFIALTSYQSVKVGGIHETGKTSYSLQFYE